MKFKVGDRVKIIKSDNGNIPKGEIGTIIKDDGAKKSNLQVDFDNPTYGDGWWSNPHELKLVKKAGKRIENRFIQIEDNTIIHEDRFVHIEKDTLKRIGVGLLTLGYFIWGTSVFFSLGPNPVTAANMFVFISTMIGTIIGGVYTFVE